AFWYDGGSDPNSTASTVAPTTTVPPLTSEELAWLKAVAKLQKTMEKTFSETSVYLTRAKMTSYAAALRGCSRELARIGSPSDRLQPVYALVQKACRTLDKGATCYLTAAGASMADGGVVAGSPEERTQRRALDCAGAAHGNGMNLLGDAAAKGEEVKTELS
ncbi:MAG TPA: hypothetical protein VFD04_16685, partial [Actinomycetes bacterium]|nr:hypothetical protein [Actinomycetes bacterium]